MNRLVISKKTLCAGLLALGSSGCISSMNSSPQLDALQGLVGGGKSYVEAYIEYRGPQERWAGPTTFLMHVNAREGTMAKVTVTPDAFANRKLEPAQLAPSQALAQAQADASRRPASQLSMPLSAAAANAAAKNNPGISGENARNQLNQLAAALQGGDVAFEGCLSPVRVRLIRSDGAILEKQGCRSVEGWPKAASEAVHQFIVASATSAGAATATVVGH